MVVTTIKTIENLTSGQSIIYKKFLRLNNFSHLDSCVVV